MKTAIPKPSKQSIIREARDYVMIAIGMILYGIGWTVFLLPNRLSGAIYVFHYQLLPAAVSS